VRGHQVGHRRGQRRPVDVEQQPGQRGRNGDQRELPHRGQQHEARGGPRHPEHQGGPATDPVREVSADDL
jgi:hypothetical protein